MRGALLILLLLTACEPGDGKSDAGLNSCDAAAGNADVAGTWRIEGAGSRRDCPDALWNTDQLTLSTPALTVTQDDDGVLVLGPVTGLPENTTAVLKSNSRVTGQCVTFNLLEETRASDGTLDTTEWRFSGTREADGNVRGTFDLDGPGACRGEGTFRATIE